MMPDVLRDAQHLAPGFLVSEKTPVPKLNAIGGKKSKEKTGHLGIKGWWRLGHWAFRKQ